MTLSIQEAIQQGSDELLHAGIEDSQREAGALLSYVLGKDRVYLVAHSNDLLNEEQANIFQSCVARRAAGEPPQYITGHQEFYKLDFELTPDVLIPRPETEAIVEVVLDLLKHEHAPLIADVGTGSGCIAISFLKERPDARAVATDISVNALAVTAQNADRHGVGNRLQLVESDLLAKLQGQQQFSLIASNPPYIPESDWASLPREVREYEPRHALISGLDGLNDIRRLLEDTPCFLRDGGYFVFEIGFGQEGYIKTLIDPRVWRLLEVRSDLQGIPRTVVLQRKNIPV